MNPLIDSLDDSSDDESHTETQTSEYDFIESVSTRVSEDEFAYQEPILPSPPQTYPEDLRVDTRIKEEEKK